MFVQFLCIPLKLWSQLLVLDKVKTPLPKVQTVKWKCFLIGEVLSSNYMLFVLKGVNLSQDNVRIKGLAYLTESSCTLAPPITQISMVFE